MKAALEVVLALRQVIDLQFASLHHARLRHIDVRETSGTFRNHLLATIKSLDEPAAELLYFCEGVRLATLVRQDHVTSTLHRDVVRFEIPPLVRGSRRGLLKKITEADGRSE